MVEPLWGTRASPLWSGLWPCSCVQQSLPLCGVNRVSPHGPVSTRQASLAVLIEPVGRRLLPYTPWRYCRSIRPKHWETCTRVGTTWRFYMSCVLRRTSRSERRRWPHSLWVVRCPRLWSRSAISGCVSLTWRSRRRYSSWMLPCHRPAFSATLSRAVPSSFRQHRSRLRRSSTSCAGGKPEKEEESGECYTTHPDPAPRHHRPGLHRPRAGSLCSTSLPHHGYVGGSVGAAGTVSRSLASAPPVRLGGSYGPSDSAMRFSSPGVPPSSGASGSLQSNPPMLLSCVRKSQSYWRRTR